MGWQLVSALPLPRRAIVCIAIASGAYADTVNTLDGARLVGTIDKVTPKEIALKTTYAGKLTVAMDQVASFSTDQPLTTQLTDSTTVTGATSLDAKTLHMTGDAGASAASLDLLQAAWQPGDTPPPESLYDLRHWSTR